MTAGEVLVRLRRLAMTQKQQAQANENLESLMARALHDPVEARRIQAALLADGDSDTLLDLLAKRRASAASIAEEALVVCELATVLEKIGRAEDGLQALLEILVRVPDSVEAHSLTRGLAARLGKAATYLETVTAAADKLRRADDAGCLADLLLRAADVAENDLEALDRAQGFLRRAEQTGRRGAEVMSALARIAARTGDAAEHARAVAGLRRLAEQAASFAEKADLHYRLAEAQMGSAEMRDEGLDALAKAVELLADLPRATAIVENAKVPDAALARVLPVYEKVARAAKDEHVLLDFLERRAALPGVKLGDVREGVELAVSLGEGERAERLLARAVEVARAGSGGLREGIWAVADLARRLRARGDLAGAAHVLDQARDEWANPRLTPLVREIAKAAAASPETIATAARLFEQLRVIYPTDREVWEPLLDLLAKLGDRPELQSLVEDLVEKLMSRGERGAVRMAWARFLLQTGDNGETTSAALRDVLTRGARPSAGAGAARGHLRATRRRQRGGQPALRGPLERRGCRRHRWPRDPGAASRRSGTQSRPGSGQGGLPFRPGRGLARPRGQALAPAFPGRAAGRSGRGRRARRLARGGAARRARRRGRGPGPGPARLAPPYGRSGERRAGVASRARAGAGQRAALRTIAAVLHRARALVGPGATVHRRGQPAEGSRQGDVALAGGGATAAREGTRHRRGGAHLAAGGAAQSR